MKKIKLNKIIILNLFIFLLFMVSATRIYAQYLYNGNYGNADEEKTYIDQYKTVTLHKGSMLKGVLQHSISSIQNNIDDKVELMIMLDMQLDGVNCITSGTKLIGTISKITKPEIGKNASIQIIFNTLRVPDQNDINMLGYIWTPEGYSTLGGELTQRTRYKRIVHKIKGIGSIVQLVPDGPRSMGTEIEFLPGTEFVIILERDIVLKILKD